MENFRQHSIKFDSMRGGYAGDIVEIQTLFLLTSIFYRTEYIEKWPFFPFLYMYSFALKYGLLIKG